MSVVGWCASHCITKANYYYRLRRVREACLEGFQGETFLQQIVPVKLQLLQQEGNPGSGVQPGLDPHKEVLGPCNRIHAHAPSCGGP